MEFAFRTYFYGVVDVYELHFLGYFYVFGCYFVLLATEPDLEFAGLGEVDVEAVEGYLELVVEGCCHVYFKC